MHEIGIGITTTPKRKIMPYHLPGAFIYENIDKIGEGVPRSKNRCIKTLYDAGCQYFFLFDDDCYPIKDGWADHIIDYHKTTGIHHFCYMEPGIHKLDCFIDINGLRVDNYLMCGGPLLFLTREAIEKVGYVNNAYLRYGFWHSAYSHRIWKAGLMNGAYKFCSIPKLGEYIFSEDYKGDSPPINIEMPDKQKLIEHNRPIYFKEIKSNQIYYPYEGTGND